MLFYDKFLMFGDSITEMSFDQQQGFGLGAGLQSVYVRKFDMVNRGFGGYNSEHAKLLLPHILDAELTNQEKSDVKLMTIFFGTNDAVESFQNVELPQYLENMESMINSIVNRNINVVVIGPGLHDTELLLQNPDRNEPIVDNKTYRIYSDALQELCHKLKVPFLNTWKLFQVDSGYSEQEILDEQFESLSKYLTDGIHYTGAGYKLVFDELLRIIGEWYPQYHPDNMTRIMPNIMDIDPEDIGNTLFKGVDLK